MNEDEDMIGLKAKSQKELYNMISWTDKVYLFPIKDCYYKLLQ